MNKYFSLFLLLITCLGALYFISFPITPRNSDIALIIVILTIGLWASGIISEYLTALIFFTAIILLRLTPPEIVFSGFVSSSFWFIFAGLIISAAIDQSGLGIRISSYLANFFEQSYLAVITGIVVFGAIMAFIMPSAIGRMVLMTPIAVNFAKKLGYDQGTNGYTGIVLAGMFGSYFAGSAILPANIPNMILVGTMESLYHQTPSYMQYLLLHFPVLGLVKSILLVFIILKIFPDKPVAKKAVIWEEKNKVSKKEWRLIFYLAVSLILWMTDSIHHISPAWIGLAVGILCLLPFLGIIESKTFMQKTNFAPLFYVAGIIGLSAVISYTGIGALFAKKMLAILPLTPGDNIKNFYILSFLSTIIGVLTTSPGIPAVLTPLAQSISHATNLPLISVLMTQVLGYSTLILPYQAPPIIVAAQLGGVRFKDVTKLCLITCLLSMIMLFPLDYIWWHILGWI